MSQSLTKSIILLGTSIMFLVTTVYAQTDSHTSSAEVRSSRSEREMIRTAAHVVPTKRQLDWEMKETTGFVHFGLETFLTTHPNGHDDSRLFNPKQLNADQWAKTFKKAGLKHLILTVKHHNGWCLWPSKYTNYSVKTSAWKEGKGDVVKEVADACKKNGVGFGVYLSPWDMNAPSYGNDSLYNNYFVNQLTELLTQYGPIEEVWFDGNKGEGAKKQVYDFKRWYDVIRKLQPHAVIAVMGPDARWVGTETGYGRATEWSVVPMDLMDQTGIAKNFRKDLFIPRNMMDEDLGSRAKIKDAKTLIWYPSEVDVSIRPNWYYRPEDDTKVKTPKELMDIYYNSVGMNSVLLLNVPPDTNGLIKPQDQRSLFEWRKEIEETFKNNLLKNATVKGITQKEANSLTDNNYNTFWSPKKEMQEYKIEFHLPEKKTISVAALQENIQIGQRVESFRIDYLDENGTWQELTKGTTVGYKRLLKFKPVTVQTISLSILSSRLTPTLSLFGLYKGIGSF